LRTQTRLQLVDLHRQLGTTFVYVTHDQVEAMTMADRIAIISEGRLQQVGAPQAVYERPANLFVAGFIGSPPMNMISGTMSSGASGNYVTTSAGTLAVPDPGSATDGQPVVIGIRPEHLAMGPDTPTALRASVENVELLGHERHLLCKVGESLMIVRQSIDEPAPEIGSNITLVADTAGMHLFDPTTSERLN